MSSNPMFAMGEFTGPLGAQQNEKEWVALADNLKNHGPQKTVEQWKHTWRNLKKRAREDGGKIQRCANATGNNVPIPKLPEQSQKFLDIIGHQCASGIASGEETGFGDQAIIFQPPAAEFGEELLPPPPVFGEEFPPTAPEYDTEVIGEELSGSTAGPIVKRPRSGRRQLPTSTGAPKSKADSFIKAQQETNKLLKELTNEIRTSNELRSQQLSVLQAIADKMERFVP